MLVFLFITTIIINITGVGGARVMRGPLGAAESEEAPVSVTGITDTQDGAEVGNQCEMEGGDLSLQIMIHELLAKQSNDPVLVMDMIYHLKKQCKEEVQQLRKENAQLKQQLREHSTSTGKAKLFCLSFVLGSCCTTMWCRVHNDV